MTVYTLHMPNIRRWQHPAVHQDLWLCRQVRLSCCALLVVFCLFAISGQHLPHHSCCSVGLHKSISEERRQRDWKCSFRQSSVATVSWAVLSCFQLEGVLNVHCMYNVSKKNGSLRLIWHNFANSQHSLIIFGRERPYSILSWLR